MSGSGYAIGLAMATYEWIAALGLILVAKFFIPIFLEKKIFTMPQFLEERFDKRVKTVMAVFWLAVFIFINLTSILYLGALTIEKVMGIPMLYGIIGLAAFAGIYSIYGGLKAVALTDVVQVVFLVGGGLVTTYIALDLLGEGGGVYQGMVNLYGEASDKFHLILDKSHPGYKDLPGISVILGGSLGGKPLLLGMQPVYHPTRVGRQIGPGGAERDAFRRFHQAVHPAFGRDSRHCRPLRWRLR